MKNLLLIILPVFSCLFIHAQSNIEKPVYAGNIEYTKGNFDSYNYPVKGDSVLVYLKDSTINFTVFSSKENTGTKNFGVKPEEFQLVSKREYRDQVAPDKTLATGDYDMKFISRSLNNYAIRTLYLNHYGNGSTAEMVLFIEIESIHLNDLFVATLVKLK